MEAVLRPTDEQNAITEEVRSGGGHVLVDALAGTGKTSSLVLAASAVRGFALALAFNKKNAEELGRRLPPNFECKTMNSLGFGALRRAYPGVKWDIDARKLGGIVSAQSEARGRRLKGDKWLQVLKLVESAQREGLRLGEIGEDGAGMNGLMPDSPMAWSSLADELWIDDGEQEELIEYARAALGESVEATARGSISFDDQLYFPIVEGLRFERFDVVFGDEAQDWNGLQHELVRRSLRGRLVAAGDPRQAIYGWRGARADSMEDLRAELEGGSSGAALRDVRKLGLTMTWRCPRAIVQRQLWHAPGYRAGEGAPEGMFAKLGGGFSDEDNFSVNRWGMKEILELRPTPASSMVVLCRNNAPLFRLAFKLLRQRISIVMQGTDLGKQLEVLSRKVEPSNTASSTSFLKKLAAWEEEALAKAKENETKKDSISDRADCLRAVAEACRTTGELREALGALFKATSGTLTLSTIHRAKGLEWDVVVHLDPWRVPGKRALREGGEELRQAWNLKYVAETRTKRILAEGDLEGFA